MKSMGMQLPTIKQISFYEMTRYCIEAVILTALVMVLLNIAGISYISSMMIYYGFFAYATYAAYNIILELMIVCSFNQLLAIRMGGNL